MLIKVGGYSFVIEGDKKAASIQSDLHETRDSDELNGALDALESLILAHYCAGVDVDSEAYKIGVATALDAIFNNLLT